VNMYILRESCGRFGYLFVYMHIRHTYLKHDCVATSNKCLYSCVRVHVHLSRRVGIL